MRLYTVKELAKLAGVSVRTLHHYDQVGLLSPSVRTSAGYRLYGGDELLRLQQILFYKELDFELKQVVNILDEPGFDLLKALAQHKEQLLLRKQRIDTLLATLDNTIIHLTNKHTMKAEDLYAGLPKEQAEAWANEAREQWPQQVKHAEKELLKMSTTDFKVLQEGFKANWEKLATMTALDPASEIVQSEIDSHYQYILKFWGKAGNQAEAYKGLGDLYANDERYTEINGMANPAFGKFLQQAIGHYVANNL